MGGGVDLFLRVGLRNKEKPRRKKRGKERER